MLNKIFTRLLDRLTQSRRQPWAVQFEIVSLPLSPLAKSSWPDPAFRPCWHSFCFVLVRNTGKKYWTRKLGILNTALFELNNKDLVILLYLYILSKWRWEKCFKILEWVKKIKMLSNINATFFFIYYKLQLRN